MAARQRAGLTLAGLIGVCIALAGFSIALDPIHDNSFLTHLATGRLILDHGVPTHDPYSFTAAGDPWVVQSWLASLIYGGLEELFDARAIVIFTAVIGAILGLIAWALSRPASSLIGRIVVVLPVLAVATDTWSERPLLIGLLCFALVILAGEGRLDPRWLVPIMWVWVNTHGSFPFGIVYLVVVAVGERLDRADPAAVVRALKWSGVGLVVGAINPIGPRLLWFPVELLQRRDVLDNVVEWQAPGFRSIPDRAFLLQVLLLIVLLVRKPSWRAALPLLVFLPVSLFATRNLLMATFALLPHVAHQLPKLGSLTGDQRRPVFAPAALVVLALAPMGFFARANDAPYRLQAYPVKEFDRLERLDAVQRKARVLTTDYAGNYLEWRYGTDFPVFFDDRFDMYPREVDTDYDRMLSADPKWQDVLDKYEIEYLVWPKGDPLAEYVRLSDTWKIGFTGKNWILACRSDATC